MEVIGKTKRTAARIASTTARTERKTVPPEHGNAVAAPRVDNEEESVTAPITPDAEGDTLGAGGDPAYSGSSGSGRRSHVAAQIAAGIGMAQVQSGCFAMLFAPSANSALVARIREFTPVTPALRAQEAPLANDGTGYEQRPDRHVVDQFNAVGSLSGPKYGAPRLAQLLCSISLVLDITAPQQYRDVPPWMVVKGAVIIAATEVVQIDVEAPVARDYPPTQHVWAILPADDEVWGSRKCQGARPHHRVITSGASKFPWSGGSVIGADSRSGWSHATAFARYVARSRGLVVVDAMTRKNAA